MIWEVEQLRGSTWPSQPLSAEEKTQGLAPASDTQALAAALAPWSRRGCCHGLPGVYSIQARPPHGPLAAPH